MIVYQNDAKDDAEGRQGDKNVENPNSTEISYR